MYREEERKMKERRRLRALPFSSFVRSGARIDPTCHCRPRSSLRLRSSNHSLAETLSTLSKRRAGVEESDGRKRGRQHLIDVIAPAL